MFTDRIEHSICVLCISSIKQMLKQNPFLCSPSGMLKVQEGVYNVRIYLLSFPIESWQYSVAHFSMQVVRHTPIPQMLSHMFQFLRYPFLHLPISLGTRQICLKIFIRLIALLMKSYEYLILS